MKRTASALCVLLVVLLTGCTVRPSEVFNGGDAATGIAKGTPVYLLDSEGNLVLRRPTSSLGTIGQALRLLLTGTDPDAGSLHSRVHLDSVPTALDIPVTTSGDTITVRLPIPRRRVHGAKGIDQIVCTVLAVHIQRGGDPSSKVVLTFTTDRPTEPRTCPVLGR
ncbi:MULTISPECIES: hypothetical protein [Actinopolyspora]|uniref:Sporulation and spore germination n=1 Tax=Actinopolyspora saharensis TaxID=995062 RepID=A0A1H1FS37_9ACTN|nr:MULTISPECIES: hypothetical protein [Actinopolyspora]NHD19471.1 hypothetical protein [Actinopolyspora sp. BKK2]NHE77411.1 hypothetical protein [Actinopolyspora sp. BKK1]SDR03747.1 hypothetical protein SAMN04489718_3202 [Actinopolyspora saharensis]